MRKAYTLWSGTASKIVADNFLTKTNQEIADEIARKTGEEYSMNAVSSKGKRLGLARVNPKEVKWTEGLSEYLPTIYPENPLNACAKIIEDKYGLSFNPSTIAHHVKRLGLKQNQRGYRGIRQPKIKTHGESKIISTVTFETLKPHHCRYMDVGRAYAPVCGKPIVKGSYCLDCYILTHDTIKGKSETDKKMRTHLRKFRKS